jgi:preprotein translocase subunit SecG
MMEILKTILMVIFILICIALTVIILFQEGKSAGLGSLSGQNFESYWSRNKSRSREGLLVRGTTVLVVLFFILSAVLNIGALK